MSEMFNPFGGSGEGSKKFGYVEFSDNKINFYDKEGGTLLSSVDYPVDKVIDQTKTEFVPDFTWSDLLYPGSTNPDLEGSPVLVLAVKGDEGENPSYSFLGVGTIINVFGADEYTTTLNEKKIAVIQTDESFVDELLVDFPNATPRGAAATKTYELLESYSVPYIDEYTNRYTIEDEDYLGELEKIYVYICIPTDTTFGNYQQSLVIGNDEEPYFQVMIPGDSTFNKQGFVIIYEASCENGILKQNLIYGPGYSLEGSTPLASTQRPVIVNYISSYRFTLNYGEGFPPDTYVEVYGIRK